MDFSKGAMFVACVEWFAGTGGDGGSAADGAGSVVLPGQTAKSPWMKVSKPQRATPAAAVL